jgi:hypothetical protein
MTGTWKCGVSRQIVKAGHDAFRIAFETNDKSSDHSAVQMQQAA